MMGESRSNYTLMSRPGTLALPGNLIFATESGASGVMMRRQSTGHQVFFRPDGRRFLMTDPHGHPLHECEWSVLNDGSLRLSAARLYLDWGQWVGIKPEGLINSITMDLSTRQGWQQITRQDLRTMASRILRVPLSEVEFFYGDEDLSIEPTGKAVIRQRKDALYVLKNGSFDHEEFMSCMSAMHWDKIDYLPVVELFKSLLPGTGSAAFELIRGLYDDQNPGHSTPLTYRGIPTYPSEGAFGLFSNFFTPTHPSGRQPFEIFMDPSRSHEIAWLPNADPPYRYVDSDYGLCLTVRKGKAQKVTMVNDSTGLPFVAPNSKGFAAAGKLVEVQRNILYLRDQDVCREISLHPEWGILSQESSPEVPVPLHTWRMVFPDGVPPVPPAEAFSAVLLYPEDDTTISEWSSQPFVADYLDDVMEQDARLAAHRVSCSKVLVHGFDATIGTCLLTNQPCAHAILFSHAAYAQKHAQILWNLLARANHLDQLPNYRFLSGADHAGSEYGEAYDLIYRWIPYKWYADPKALSNCLADIHRGLRHGGIAFIAGPESLSQFLQGLSFHILFGEAVCSLPTFQMHRSILPKAQLHPELFVWAFLKQ